MSGPAEVRAEAARVLLSVLQGRSLDAALRIDPQSSAQERGLLRSLCFDSARWYFRLDALLNRLLSRPGQKLHPEVRALAIIGLCQLVYTQTPAHAIVAETVNAARVLGHPRAAGLINALLRRTLREQAVLLEEIDADLPTRTSHPRWLVEQLAADWPERHLQILDANNERPPFWLRVNTQRVSAGEYRRKLEQAGLGILESRFEGECLCLERAVDVAELPGFAKGFVSVQDAAAQLAGRLMSPKPKDRILDACCAPGGKTGHLLELQPELAELVAVDSSAERLLRVHDNLRRLGLRANVIAADVGEPESWWDGRMFQRILLDVPCSATGVIRRHPDIKLLRRPEDIPALAVRQAQLLRTVWPMLESGGRLVYASCSALRAETSEVIEAFLASTSQARDITRSAFEALGPDIELDIEAATGHRIPAGSGRMDGFYYACLYKEGSD